MQLVPMIDLLNLADRRNEAIAAINISNIETIQSVLEAAVKTNYPVILQVAPIQMRLEKINYHEITEITKIIGEKYDVKVALHLDHAKNIKECFEAIDAGFTSVMYDGSEATLLENINNTNKVVKYAENKKVTVEGELGKVVGVEGSSGSDLGLMTDPDEAYYYVQNTGVHCLAVSIGNAHGEYKLPPKLNFELLDTIRKRTNIPIVLHGGTGIPENDIIKAISLGIRKINFFTEIDRAFMKGFVGAYDKNNNCYMMACEEAAQEEMEKRIIEKINLCKINNKMEGKKL